MQNLKLFTGKTKTALDKDIQTRNSALCDANLASGIKFEILDEFVRVLKKLILYIWCNKAQIVSYLDFFVKKHGCNFEILFWVKSNPLPAFHKNYLVDKEYCFYFRNGGYCNPQTYEDAKSVFFEPFNIRDKKLFAHPTIKPLKFIATMIKNSSKPNELIFDPFMGSGTTAIAATELGRNFIGFEHNPKWHKISCDRLNGITANGQTSFILR